MRLINSQVYNDNYKPTEGREEYIFYHPWVILCEKLHASSFSVINL